MCYRFLLSEILICVGGLDLICIVDSLIEWKIFIECSMLKEHACLMNGVMVKSPDSALGRLGLEARLRCSLAGSPRASYSAFPAPCAE